MVQRWVRSASGRRQRPGGRVVPTTALAIWRILARTNLQGSSSSVTAGQRSSACEPSIFMVRGSGLVLRCGRVAQDLRRDQLGDGRQHRRAVDDRAEVGEAGDRAADVARLAEQVLDDAAQIAVVRDDDVLAREVLAPRSASAQPRVARIVEAGEAAVEQRARAGWSRAARRRR